MLAFSRGEYPVGGYGQTPREVAGKALRRLRGYLGWGYGTTLAGGTVLLWEWRWCSLGMRGGVALGCGVVVP